MYDNNGYRKDSMDRLGDDLTEEVIQYLTFSDKVRLECVSKQWMRYILQKQSVIKIKVLSSKSYVNAFELFVKKIPNIKKVILLGDVSRLLFRVIGRYCPNIKSLDFRYLRADINTMEFFVMYGHKLEELSLRENWIIKDIEKVLKFCPNLKRVSVANTYVLFTKKDKNFLPKLQYIRNLSPTYVYITGDIVNRLKIFTDKYSQTMKTLNISLWRMTEEQLKTCIECISRFENLQSLTLEFGQIITTQPIDDCLSLIGQNCNKLLKLDLNMENTVRISNQFFDIFNHFEAIKKLKIELPHKTVYDGSVECFKHCKQLKHLDINYDGLMNNSF